MIFASVNLRMTVNPMFTDVLNGGLTEWRAIEFCRVGVEPRTHDCYFERILIGRIYPARRSRWITIVLE